MQERKEVTLRGVDLAAAKAGSGDEQARTRHHSLDPTPAARSNFPTKQSIIIY